MKIEMPFLRTSHPVRVTWNAVLLAAILVSSLTVSYVTSFGAGRSNN